VIDGSFRRYFPSRVQQEGLSFLRLNRDSIERRSAKDDRPADFNICRHISAKGQTSDLGDGELTPALEITSYESRRLRASRRFAVLSLHAVLSACPFARLAIHIPDNSRESIPAVADLPKFPPHYSRRRPAALFALSRRRMASDNVFPQKNATSREVTR